MHKTSGCLPSRKTSVQTKPSKTYKYTRAYPGPDLSQLRKDERMQTGLQRDHPGQQSHAPARDNGPQRHKRDNSGHQRRALILRAAGGVLGKPLQPISAVLRGRTSGSDIPGALHFGRRLICICLVYTHIISIEGPLLILIYIVMS